MVSTQGSKEAGRRLASCNSKPEPFELGGREGGGRETRYLKWCGNCGSEEKKRDFELKHTLDGRPNERLLDGQNFREMPKSQNSKILPTLTDVVSSAFQWIP